MELRQLERLKDRYGDGHARAKLELLGALERARLRTAGEVARLHEVLCFLRAYPDDRRVLTRVERMLGGFARRADLRRQRESLEQSGIAGTNIRYPFYWPTARWLAERWPRKLTLDRLDRLADRAIGKLFGVGSGFQLLDRIRPRRPSDAVYFVRLIERMPGDAFDKERYYDAIEPVLELHAGGDTPSRTRAWRSAGPVVFQRAPLERRRPDLEAEIRRRPRRVRSVARAEGARLIDLARAAMVTRSRDLDAFAYGDARAVRLIEDGAGLAFALNGVIPERHLPHATPYGALTLKNGVPIGYIQLDIAGPLAELSFNTFATFRGGEAARVFARALAMAHHLFGATSFAIEPYQLGKGNDEGIETGAWWFYSKLGFRPRSREGKRLARAELARQWANPAYRSSEARLRMLAEHPLYYDLRR